MPLAMFSVLRTAIATRCLSWFHTNFKIAFFISVKRNTIRIFIMMTLNV